MSGITVRELEPEDVQHGLLESLEALSPVELDRFQGTILACCRIYGAAGKMLPKVVTFVAETAAGEIVGTASLLLEQKFIHGGGIAGHVEDVAVHETWQGKGLGRLLVERCLLKARALGCYKVVLVCDDDVVRFYERLGFRQCGHAMRLDIEQGAGVGEGQGGREGEEHLPQDGQRGDVRRAVPDEGAGGGGPALP